MFCPFCHADDTRVLDSRLTSEGTEVKRRRECQSCQVRFTTYEKAVLDLPVVIKKDEVREAFNEDKLRMGLLRSLEKRPVSMEQIDLAVHKIKSLLQGSAEREIPSHQIGQWVMDMLKDLDEVAYVRFASVYRQFQDVNEFRAELDRLIDKS